MGTKQVNKDRKNYDLEEQKLGRKDLEDRKRNLPLNEIETSDQDEAGSAKKKSHVR